MQVLLIFVPLILSVLLVGALAKLSVFLSRSGALSWKHSFFFAGFLFTLAMSVRVFLEFVPLPMAVPLMLRVAFGLALMTVFAAFFFGHHAVTADCSAIGRSGAVKAAVVWAGMSILLSLLVLLLVPRP